MIDFSLCPERDNRTWFSSCESTAPATHLDFGPGYCTLLNYHLLVWKTSQCTSLTLCFRFSLSLLHQVPGAKWKWTQEEAKPKRSNLCNSLRDTANYYCIFTESGLQNQNKRVASYRDWRITLPKLPKFTFSSLPTSACRIGSCFPLTISLAGKFWKTLCQEPHRLKTQLFRFTDLTYNHGYSHRWSRLKGQTKWQLAHFFCCT